MEAMMDENDERKKRENNTSYYKNLNI